MSSRACFAAAGAARVSASGASRRVARRGSSRRLGASLLVSDDASRSSRRAVVASPSRARPRRRAAVAPAAALPAEVGSVLSQFPAFLADSSPGVVPAAGFNTVVFTLGIGVLLRGLTWPGVLNSWILGATVMAAFGVRGYLLVCLYFILGSAVTKLKLEQKQREGIAEARSGRRGVGSVWGSGGAGVACAALALLAAPPGADLYRLGFVASFCSKLSDTCASEVGKAYGRTTYSSVPPFRAVPRGTEGAVSLEGTLAGLIAAAAFALAALAAGQVDARGAGIATLAAFVATTLESWVGATTQGEEGFEWLTNDVVNLAQITVAAAVAIAVAGAGGGA